MVGLADEDDDGVDGDNDGVVVVDDDSDGVFVGLNSY